MVLITWCECCYTSKTWHKEIEKYLLLSVAIQCPHCNQISKVPLELKENIRKNWGMFHGK